jgi:Formate/nitrite transporter
VVENLVHTVNDKTVRSGAWLIFAKAVFANYFINVSVIVAMQLREHLIKIVVLMMGVVIFAYMGFQHLTKGWPRKGPGIFAANGEKYRLGLPSAVSVHRPARRCGRQLSLTRFSSRVE